uniref:Uncharacterized protein n=2 Tax=Clastoptera arizonana TaxID=38151 RepID=A0A1B6CWV5_9HEMI
MYIRNKQLRELGQIRIFMKNFIIVLGTILLTVLIKYTIINRYTMTPIEDFMYLLNSVLLGEEPTIEDFILLVGTCVAFIAFVLWCCFPIVPKEANAPLQYDPRGFSQYKKLDPSYEIQNS